MPKRTQPRCSVSRKLSCSANWSLFWQIILRFEFHIAAINRDCERVVQVRHRRTCRKARAPKELSSARLCDPPEAQLSAGDCLPLLK